MTATLKRVRLQLARTPEFPEGSPEYGYEFVAPVNSSGHIDSDAWKKVRDRCRVTRFAGQETETGMLRHVGRGWRFDYDGSSKDDDEPLFKLDRHALTDGAYVSITEHDGIQRPFKVVSVAPA
jgi:hypothetical protein